MILTHKSEGDSYIENKLTVTKGASGEGLGRDKLGVWH